MSDHDGEIYKDELRLLLSRVDEVLTSFGIEFFAVYGTCLGAVRNGGIIPWDDDIDIAVRREDFKRAIAVLNRPETNLFAGDHSTIAECPCRCGRVFNRIEANSIIERKRAYVDLHVIDNAPVGDLQFYWRVLWYVGVSRIVQKRANKNNAANSHPLLYCLADIVAFPLRIFPASRLKVFADWLYVYPKKTGRLKITYDGNRKRYLATDFNSARRISFDGMSIPVPAGAESYLSMCYGDWATPPPVSDRMSHQFDSSGSVWNVALPKDEDRMILRTDRRPLLSIVIANYNYGRFLGEAIESVLNQSCQDYELIVCDAKSTDNSVEVIKKYEEHIKWWCSEPDGGQSAAFNKGFSHAKGRFLTWLNADDVMLPGTIEKLEKATIDHPSQEWFVGGVFWLDPQMRILKMGRGRPFSEIRFREGDVSAWGPSSFFTKRLLESVGGVDERFHFVMDTDLWLRMAISGVRYLPFCNYAWGLRIHQDSKMSGHKVSQDGTVQVEHTEDKFKAGRHYARIQQEKSWLREYFKPERRTLFSRVISADLTCMILTRLDRIRYRGRHYKEYFK